MKHSQNKLKWSTTEYKYFMKLKSSCQLEMFTW